MSEADPVYDIEHRLWSAIEAGVLVSGGRTWELEPEQSFATLSAASLFCTLTCIERGLPPVSVRWRKGEKRSHYEPWSATIALASWGGTRTVLCHELAHHEAEVRHRVSDHGPTFRAILCELLAHTGAPVQAEYLRTAFKEL